MAGMAGIEQYALGYRVAEQQRLQRQGEQLSDEAARLFDEIGVSDGARVLEIGCGPRGCLDLLSTRVGALGRVVAVEISSELATLAQGFVTERGLRNVEVIAGDARSTGLPAGSFDLVAARLLLVNIPRPEDVVSQAVALARPGGAVAFHEVDWAAFMCDPPSHAWTTALQLFNAVNEKNGNDHYLGRRLPRLLRDAGLVDIHIHPILHVHPPGDPRRNLVVDFVDNFRERILALDLIAEDDLRDLKQALAAHLDDPETVVFIGPYIQAWGRKPPQVKALTETAHDK
jgi:SAM-dependent methyltransferase